MKTLYIECNMGAAGDMLMSALSELHPDIEGFLDRLSQAEIPGVTFTHGKAVKCGIVGTHIEVAVEGTVEGEHVHTHHEHTHAHAHSHRSMEQIEHIIKQLKISDTVKTDAIAVYHLIAEAESRVHGTTVSEIHFHEVGTMDAVADIVGVCMLMEELHPDRILASPVHVGSGQVKCAHGILPVPAPATTLILKDVPIYGGEVKGELCTPTGAALLKYFVDEFCTLPVMEIDRIGYGMGTKDFEIANCIRVLYGEQHRKENSICELSCNMDDMTGEDLAYVSGILLEHGAREVFTTPIGMKKGRPGILLTCLCDIDKKQEILELIFTHTTTIGIREKKVDRYILERRIEECNTPYGTVHVKVSEGYGVKKSKPEYEDLAHIAKEHGISLAQVRKDCHYCE